MTGNDTRARAAAARTDRAGYNGRKALPVLRTLREIRVDAGLSLSSLEEASGVNRAILSQVERGRLVATRDEMDAIAAAMGMPAGELEVRTLVVREVMPE